MKALLPAVLSLFLASSARAEAPAAPEGSAAEASVRVPRAGSKGARSCRKDIAKFCKQVKPGKGRLGRCLLDHFPKLSGSCRRFAGHGGEGHELASLSDIDEALEAPAKK